MLKRFKMGGVHPPGNKTSSASPVEVVMPREKVIISLQQHIGAPATPVVEKGDKVKTGQLIGKAAGFVSANIHSAVSGTVIAVDMMKDAGSLPRMAVVIQVEGDEWDEAIDRSGEVVGECTLSPSEIIAKISAAGIVGLGGATFPTHVKLTVPVGAKAEYLLVNGAECEPYLTTDHRTMLERGEEMVAGARIIARALGVKKTYIGIENNKREAIERLRVITSGDGSVEVVALRTMYPQGGEKQLIDAILGRKVPSGKLPIDVGCVVQNVGTCVAVYEAVQKNKPLVERVVTVTGKSVGRAANLSVRIGTPISELIEYCGGMPEDTDKVILGGPMMGRAIANMDTAVTKGTSGVLMMPGQEAVRKTPQVCIKCAKCVGVCPMGLEPYLLSKLAQRGMYEEMEQDMVTDCIECGSCVYTCPGSLPLLDYIRLGKGEVLKMIRSRKQ